VSPMFPSLVDPSGSSREGDAGASGGPPSGGFKEDLMEYLAAYGTMTQGRNMVSMKRIQAIVGGHDMSATRARLVASVPGRHRGGVISKWGHLKLRKLVSHISPPRTLGPSSQTQLVCQYSSVGTLGKAEQWLGAEFASSLRGGRESGTERAHLRQ